MTRTALVCVMAVLAVAGQAAAAAADQLPRIDAEAPRSVGFADTFDYVVVATVPVATAATARLTADVGPFSVVESTPLERTRRGDRSCSGSLVVLPACRRAASGTTERRGPCSPARCSSPPPEPSEGGPPSSPWRDG